MYNRGIFNFGVGTFNDEYNDFVSGIFCPLLFILICTNECCFVGKEWSPWIRTVVQDWEVNSIKVLFPLCTGLTWQ
jgi:hypothetical protein